MVQDQSQIRDTNHPSNHPKNNKKKDDKLPDWLPNDVWQSFVAHRKAIGKKLTPRAVELILRKLERFRADGHNPITALEQSIENGWTGVFAPKETPNDRNTKALTHGLSSDLAKSPLGSNPETTVRVISRMFGRFEALWGGKWRREENNPDAWASALAEFSFAAVGHAATHAPIDFPAWPPTLAEFMALARSYREPLEDRYLALEAKPTDRKRAKAAIAELAEKLRFN